MDAPSSQPPLDPTDFEETVAEALQAFEQHGSAGLEQFLAARPTLERDLRKRLDNLQQAGLLTPPSATTEPSQFGEFRVIKKLASGGMGVVYLAEQTSLHRKVALKAVRPEFLGSQVTRHRFQREIEAVARLTHPGIVPILAVGPDSEVPWFAMEFVDGFNLEHIIKVTQPRDPSRMSAALLRETLRSVENGKRASSGTTTHGMFAGTYQECCVRLTLQVAQAMSYVHDRGIVHRDLKPSNIMLTPHGQAQVLDFGLAQVQDNRRLTQEAAAVGSPAYMAPEQLLGEAVDLRVDIYGLGVTLYELLTGVLPFEATTMDSQRQLVVDGIYRPVNRVRKGISRDLACIVNVAMDRDRSRRYASMQELANDLERVLAHEPINARSLPLSLKTWRVCQRHPGWTAIVAAMVFLLLQFPLVLLWFETETNAELAAHNKELRRAKDDESKARKDASLNFAEAYAAIGSTLKHTNNWNFEGMPEGEQMQIAVLVEATEVLQRLTERRPQDIRIRLDAAHNRIRLGVLQRQVGKAESAQSCFRAVTQSLATICHPIALRIRARAGVQLGQLLSERGRSTEALDVLDQAVCDIADAIAMDPTRDSRRISVDCKTTLALAYGRTGKRGKRKQVLHEALKSAQAVYAEDPNSMVAALTYATACDNWSHSLRADRQLGEALEVVGRGIEAMRQCPAVTQPANYRHALAALLNLRGTLLRESTRFTEALEVHGQALALRLELAQLHPNTSWYLNEVGGSFQNLAVILMIQGHRKQALNYSDSSLEYSRRALQLDPERPNNRQFYENALCTQGALLESAGHFARSAAAGRELARFSTKNATALFAARLLARSAAEQDAPGESERLLGESAQLVARAIDHGFDDLDHFTLGKWRAHYALLHGVATYEAALAKLR